MGIPDPKEVFKKLDRDGDGKLSLEEFTAGMKRFHETMMERFRGRPPIPSGGPREMARRTHDRPAAPGPTAGAQRGHKGHEMAKHRPPKPEKPAKPEKPEKPEPGAKPQAKEKA